jgi:hypothetical protein
MEKNLVSAVFDDRSEAERAVGELRAAGIPDSAISILGSPDVGGDVTDEDDDGAGKASVAGAIAAGGVGGALLGVAALAIPGVGPLAAAGAIAASAIPTAAGVGAAVGATGGAITRMLTDHDVARQDAEYYEEHIQRGGVFVSVNAADSAADREVAREILQRFGGHSASSPRVEAV